ncbi:MAG: universal stress protein [Betaproteobacteria bacterium]|jgi:nucleotide-binding universal stress UspA family protein
MFKNILIPTDGSALSKKAIKAGVDLARATGARVTGFYSPERYEILAYGEYFPPDLISRSEWDDRSKKTAARFLSVIEKEAANAGVRYTGLYLDSVTPWEAIVEAAKKKKCDLIFMASHGRSGISSLLLGSQAAKVLSHSRIPVLVYK